MADVDQRVSVAARHAGVDLGDHNVGALGGGARGFRAGAQRAETVFIGKSKGGRRHTRGREVEETHVHVVAAVSHKRGNLAEEDGNLVVKGRRGSYVVVLSAVHSLTGVSADKQITSVEDAVELYSITKKPNGYRASCKEPHPASAGASFQRSSVREPSQSTQSDER